MQPQGRAPGQGSSRDPGLDGLAGRQDSDDPDAAARGSVRFEEGPYYRTKEPWGAFRMTIRYRALDRRPVTPRPPPFPHTNQDWSDSGVYIFDRYEVQILDPSRFDSPDDPPGGVPTGGEIRDDPRLRLGGRVVPNNRNQQVPGGVYGVDPPSGGYINRANKTGEWNTLVIEFRPPSLDPSDRKVIRRAARIKTVLNGHVVLDGATADSDGRPLNGTGTGGQPDSGHARLHLPPEPLGEPGRVPGPEDRGGRGHECPRRWVMPEGMPAGRRRPPLSRLATAAVLQRISKPS